MGSPPNWFKSIDMPERLRQRLLSSFTPQADGYYRWHEGRTRYVCGKTVAPDQVAAAWDKKRAGVNVTSAPIVSVDTFRTAAERYYLYLDHRVQSGQPEPLSEVTSEDYKKIINGFGRLHVGGVKVADTPLSAVAQDHFTTFAKTMAGHAPSTLARAVASVHAMLAFLVDEGVLPAMPQFGRYFVRPSQQKHRDLRLAQRKAYQPAELGAIIEHASAEELAWIGLGLSGAMDNADLSNLTWDLIDRDKLLIDYRRRKCGKIHRLIPVHPVAWEWLMAYSRPDPVDVADAGRVFLSPTGLPLQRLRPGRNGYKNPIDYVAMRWQRLLVSAGLRQAYPTLKAGQERRKKGTGGGDGRGFRSLRHTFANLTPRGYRDELELIMGHATGTVLLENYIEEHGVEPLRELVNEVWCKAFTLPLPPSAGG